MTKEQQTDFFTKWQAMTSPERDKAVAEADGCTVNDFEGNGFIRYFCGCKFKNYKHSNELYGWHALKPYSTDVNAVLEVVKSVGMNDGNKITWGIYHSVSGFQVVMWIKQSQSKAHKVKMPFFKTPALALAFASCWKVRLEGDL